LQEESSRPSVSANDIRGAAAAKGVDTSPGVEKDARARELRELQAREQAAREQLAAARKRMAQLEKELEDERPPRRKRTRPEFDLTTEDWREMVRSGE
jgi:uncharacterized protein involved in exopolysaccharide biosynthesis